VLADIAGDGLERGAQVADLGGQPGQGAGVTARSRLSELATASRCCHASTPKCLDDGEPLANNRIQAALNGAG